MNIANTTNNSYITTYAKPSEKTDIYSFGILAWEVLTQLKPYSDITSAVELSVKIHEGVRPDINLLPKDCPYAIRNMIERCWDTDRNNRMSALKCFITLRECYELVSTSDYDVYIIYKPMSHREVLINHIRNKLIENGLKVAWMYDASSEPNEQSALTLRIELIKKSKLILLCLDEATQTDDYVVFELGNNRGLHRPRPVIPLFLEPRNLYFPDDEIKVHCFMGRNSVKVYDISKFVENSSDSINDVVNSDDIRINNIEKESPDAIIGVDPLDLELQCLINYMNSQIEQLCII